MRHSLALLLVGLTACDVPSPLEPVAGAPPQAVEVQGSTFSIRISGRDAVAVRTNIDMRARRDVILPRAGRAIEQASGCRIQAGSLQGDVARIEAKLAC